MAIDKSLPNKKVEIPGAEEKIEEQIEIQESYQMQVIQKLHQQKMVVLKLILNREHLAKNKVKAILII